MKGEEYRKLRPYEAARRAPFTFVMMFVLGCAWDAIFHQEVDWAKWLAVSAAYAILYSLALLAFKLTPKYP